MASTAINPITLDGKTFAAKVLEDRLRVEGPIQGYLYAGLEGQKLYRTLHNARWMHTGRFVLTQDNVAGGALVMRITAPADAVLHVKAMYMQGPATNTTLACWVFDEDAGELGKLASVAAGVTRFVRIPSIGSVASVHDNVSESHDFPIASGSFLYIACAAAAQTETLTVGFELLSTTDVFPTVDSTGSAGTPSLADNTISVANRTVPVVGLC